MFQSAIDLSNPINRACPLTSELKADWTGILGKSGSQTVFDINRERRSEYEFYDYDGVFVNSPTWSDNVPPNSIGRSVSFDGTAYRYVNFPNVGFDYYADFDTDSRYTISCWIYFRAFTQFARCFGTTINGLNPTGFSFALTNTGSYDSLQVLAGITPAVLYTSPALSLNTWYFIGLSKTGNSNYTVNFNGTNTTTTASASIRSSVLKLGNPGGTTAFNGNIYAPMWFVGGKTNLDLLYQEQRTGSQNFYSRIKNRSKIGVLAGGGFKPYWLRNKSQTIGLGV